MAGCGWWVRVLAGAVLTVTAFAGGAMAQSSVGSADRPAFPSDPAMRRVRHTGDLRIAGLIEEGVRDSATFRRIVEDIQATDGIVYVERGRCQTGVRACLALRVDRAGKNRVLRVVVHVNRNRPELVAAIGHELHHAADVLSNPRVTTAEHMFLHFLGSRTSLPSSGRFETQDAVRAGAQIERELRSAPRERLARGD